MLISFHSHWLYRLQRGCLNTQGYGGRENLDFKDESTSHAQNMGEGKIHPTNYYEVLTDLGKHSIDHTLDEDQG